MDFAAMAADLNDYIVSSRRCLHRSAELSMEEHKTTAFLVSELKKMGIPVITFSDYTGCIAVIKGGSAGKTVLLRADIDALPIKEATGLSYASENDGVMHACGHDCHAAMLLGAARMLWEAKKELPGTVKLLFQAGEEVFIGSRYYWDRGYLSDVDAAFGMHLSTALPSGKIAVLDGYVMASCDNFTLEVIGRSSHGSTPQFSSDAITAASAIIVNLQSVASRFNDPLEPLVVTVGKVNAGTQFNIIAGTAVMEGTVRAFSPASRGLAESAIGRVAADTAAAYGCETKLDYRRLEPCLRNADAKLNDIARNAAVKMYGGDVLARASKMMGSEDFSYITEHIPSSLFAFLGCFDEEKGCVYPIHNGKFVVNEDILQIGAAEYAQFAADYLAHCARG